MIILLFKTTILQRLYNLSDDQTEYQINDRMSFMRFSGLGLTVRSVGIERAAFNIGLTNLVYNLCRYSFF